jgi:hypothetical protein
MVKQGQRAAAPNNSTDVLNMHAGNSQVGGARQKRAARLGGGVSAIALAAMLGASPALAIPPPIASVVISPIPANGSASGFVTAGSAQQNTSATIAAAINGATGSSTTNGNSLDALPNTQTVTGNDLSAYATGNVQTNGVDLATIGSSNVANGIAVLAEQANTNTTAGSALTTINAIVSTSGLTNIATNATNNDVLALSDNLITAQVTGNIAASSVDGAVPTDYSTLVGREGTTSLSGTENGAASGNVVVATSQKNNGLQGGAGSYASVANNTVGVTVNTSGDGGTQNLTVSTDQSGNTAAATFLGNSANNDIGVSLTSGTLAGAGTLYGSLTVANAQSNHRGNTTTAIYGIGADNSHTDIYTDLSDGGDGTPALYINNSNITQDGNTVSATVTGNSAVGSGSTLSPGNEITLGINLAGTTTAEQQTNAVNSNYLTGGGSITSGADLTLGNIQDNNNMQFVAETQNGYVGTYVKNIAGSTVDISGNNFTSKVTGSVADNAINTANGAGINLISGLAALSSVQASYNLSSENAKTQHNNIGGYLGGDNYEFGGEYTAYGSTLTMTNDGFSASASANQVTNTVALSASTINAGALGESSGPAALSANATSSSTDFAGVSLNNSQGSKSPVAAYNYDNHIFASIAAYNVAYDSSSLTDTAITATATQNGANNSIALAGSQSVSGTAGLQNSQQFSGADTAAVANVSVNTDFYSDGEEVNQITNSSKLLSGTQVTAQATGNNASNSLAVSGGQITDEIGTTSLTAIVPSVNTTAGQAIADLALNNVQQTNGLTVATADGVDVAAEASSAGGGTISDSSFTVGGPASAPSIQALAIGNQGVNSVSADAGSLLSDSTGLVNLQSNSGGAAASVTDVEIDARINSIDDGGAITNTAITDGSGAVGGSNGNIIRALAYDNQVSNGFSVSSGANLTAGSTLGVDGVLGSIIFIEPPFNTTVVDDLSTGVGANFGSLNDQVMQADATAVVTSGNISIYAGNEDANAPVSASSLSNNGNLIVASAFGNQADNSGGVSANNISEGETYYPVADVTNLQSTQGEQVASSINNAEDDTFTTAVYGTGTVSGSTLRLSNDTALTQAEGNAANNSLTVAANNITDQSGVSLFTGIEGQGAFNSAAFSVQNVQYGGADINPSQINTNGQINVGGNVDSSSLVADSNQFSSTGYSDIATNALAIGATGTPVNSLDASAAVQNVQVADGVVNVVLGAPATAAVPGTPSTDLDGVPYSVASGNNSGVVTNGGLTLTITGQPMVFDLSGLTTDQKTAFEAAVPGGSLSGNSYSLSAGAYTLTNDGVFNSGTVYFTTGSPVSEQLTNDFTIPGTDGTPAIPASPSVLINVAGDINNSTLSADNNMFTTTAVANSATNNTTIDATTVNGGADITAGEAGAAAGEGLTAAVDYAVTNLQVADAPVVANTYGEAGINPTNASTISGSSLSVSGNTQSAKAEANMASNTLSLAATNAVGGEGVSPPTGALVSDQIGDGDVTATSGADSLSTIPGQVITAPGAITDSTLTLSDNSNSALALVNNATNLVDISATTLDTASEEPQNATATVAEGTGTTADYSLVNVQSANDGAVFASAVSQIGNADSTDTTTTGLNGSSVIITGNSTAADAYANEASNTLNMTAANSSATGAVLNAQDSADSVTASGIAQVGFALNGVDGDPGSPAATGSTITVSNNALQVQAVGNQASNALNASATTYGTQIGASTTNTTANATYAVLNAQGNTGNISASSVGTPGTIYAVALNSGGSTLPVSGTTVTVSYNTVGVTAFGNSANNSMTLSALNSGNATAALQNTQTNGGNITSTVANTFIGTSIGSPGSSGVTSFVGNNSIVAGAVGNSAVNNIAVTH